MDVNRSSYYKWLSRKSTPSQNKFKEKKISLLSKKYIKKHPSYKCQYKNGSYSMGLILRQKKVMF